MDRFTEMTCFVRTIETGSFAAAGKALRMSPQLVGKHMAMLEERLGVQLLVRTTRRHRLTDAGKGFYDRCRVLIKEAADAEASVADLGTKTRGQLVISAPYTFGTWRMMPFLAMYLAKHPQVSMRIVLTDRNVDVVGESFDAVIRIGALDNSSLLCRRIATLRLSACASPSYVMKHGFPKIPSDLKSHECLIYTYWFKPPLTEWAFAKGGHVESVSVSGRLQVNDGRAAIQAALLGYGIVLQDHEILKHEVHAGRLVHLLSDYVGPPREVHVVYPPSRRVASTLRSFIDSLAEYLA